jgi:hypothetical protein
MMMTLSLVVRRGVGALVTKSIIGDQHNLQIKHSINSMATRTSITREICMHMRVKQDKKNYKDNNLVVFYMHDAMVKMLVLK